MYTKLTVFTGSQIGNKNQHLPYPVNNLKLLFTGEYRTFLGLTKKGILKKTKTKTPNLPKPKKKPPQKKN